jgi:XRE family aerobic/anaerobic benzoate catabolism transcriptional regulator
MMRSMMQEPLAHPLMPSARQDRSELVYLQLLGDRVRQARARRGMTRKLLARDSGVSERYLAQLETGRGNISILLLRQLALALDMPLDVLTLDGPDMPVDLVHAVALLRRLDPADFQEARAMLAQRFGGDDRARRDRIALIGLRGAGKTTLGARLGAHLGVPFIELDREIELESGIPLSVIFDLYGQPGFRRLERQCLDGIIARHPRFVLATGGSLVSEPATFERLLGACFTIWLRAAPADHMQRVMAQGDMRPMADNRQAMADLQRILAGRETLYGKADALIETSGATVDASFGLLAGLFHPEFATPTPPIPATTTQEAT